METKSEFVKLHDFIYVGLSGDFALPPEQVLGLTIFTSEGSSSETERVLFSPVLKIETKKSLTFLSCRRRSLAICILTFLNY